jgi:choline dehydrogenase-like flavoprotein
MKVDWLIVGAGYTGCILAERLATQLNRKVLLVDRRDHVGGNAFDFYNEHGVLVHQYGPHIFHTNSKKVWDYLSQFTDWRPYYHHVLAVVEGRKVPVPFNLGHPTWEPARGFDIRLHVVHHVLRPPGDDVQLTWSVGAGVLRQRLVAHDADHFLHAADLRPRRRVLLTELR